MNPSRITDFIICCQELFILNSLNRMFGFTKFKQMQYSNSNYTQNRCNSTEYLYLDLFQFYIPLVSSKNWNKIKNSKMSSSNRVIHLEVADPDLL